MVAIDLGTGYVWAIIIALGLGCFALRVSFIQLYGWLVDFPPILKQSLGYLPPAILTALIFSQLFVPNGSLVLELGNERLVAGAVAAAVAWRTGSMMATIGVGMGALWAITFLV
jgi:branched-subunit amino acid transport protein